jgi:hypothetical protein
VYAPLSAHQRRVISRPSQSCKKVLSRLSPVSLSGTTVPTHPRHRRRGAARRCCLSQRRRDARETERRHAVRSATEVYRRQNCCHPRTRLRRQRRSRASRPHLLRGSARRPSRCHRAEAGLRCVCDVIWLILPVVIRLSQRLSHACLSIDAICTVKLRMAHYISNSLFDGPYYLDSRSNSRANTCSPSRLRLSSWGKGLFIR